MKSLFILNDPPYGTERISRAALHVRHSKPALALIQ